MKKIKSLASQRGATRLGFLDILTALVILAILIAASWKQFPIYRNGPSSNNGAQGQPPSH
jgi:hypothetical protein